MNRILLFAVLVMLITSCSDNNKKYKYVVTVKSQSVFDGSMEVKENDPVEITAPSDSDAYLDAFRRFCIALMVHESWVKKGQVELSSEHLKFALYDESGIDLVPSISFASKEAQEAEIRKSIMEIDMNESESSSEQIKSGVDSAKIKELLPFFKVKKDEFDPNGKIIYTPKSAPKYINRNGIYCYFIVNDGNPGPLRFVVQYYADDWLFFKKIQFSIDDSAYEFVPLNTETDNGDGGKIWEWFDESLTPTDQDLIYALSNAKSAKMKFIGKQYYDIKVINKAQITDIKRTLDLYHAMGGSY